MVKVIPLAIEESMSQTGSCILTLATEDGNTHIHIVVGSHEADGMQVAKKGIVSRRPRTHQLMKTVMDTYGLMIESVSIDRVVEGLFYATLHTSDGFNKQDIDSRATDAITLALLANAPIYVNETVIDECGVKALAPQESLNSRFNSLMKELRRCVMMEDYERAAEIQAQIEQLNKQPE